MKLNIIETIWKNGKHEQMNVTKQKTKETTPTETREKAETEKMEAEKTSLENRWKTWNAMYAIKFPKALYVFHSFHFQLQELLSRYTSLEKKRKK